MFMGLTLTLTAICDEIMLSFKHHSEVAHGYAELHDAALMISAVHGLMVLRQTTHTYINTHMIICYMPSIAD